MVPVDTLGLEEGICIFSKVPLFNSNYKCGGQLLQGC